MKHLGRWRFHPILLFVGAVLAMRARQSALQATSPAGAPD